MFDMNNILNFPKIKYEQYCGTRDTAHVQSTYAQQVSFNKNISLYKYLSWSLMFALTNIYQK